MKGAEQGFLLLTSKLGDPERRIMTTAQFRQLARRAKTMEKPLEERELSVSDLKAMGYGVDAAEQILTLLSQESLLEYYLRKAMKAGCRPITRISRGYPQRLKKCLGDDSPGCLWAKGDLSLLTKPAVALVGSRDLRPENREFARHLGALAAQQGLVLVSGNARGADKTAQDACLAASGQVICVVADDLEGKQAQENILWISEDSFDLAFSAQRALSRNRVIHALTDKTFVAQCTFGTGGTWDGTTRNLRSDWSAVYCFDDNSRAAAELLQMGAQAVFTDSLGQLNDLKMHTVSFFDQ